MNVLYVSVHALGDINGGSAASRRNYDCLCELYGKESVACCELPLLPRRTLLEKIKRNVKKLFCHTEYANLLECVKDIGHFDLVYLDSARIGTYIKVLKRNGFKGTIITFFHNCELDLVKTDMKGRNIFLKWVLEKSVRANEVEALCSSDICVFINHRDLERIIELYEAKPTRYFVDPMSMKDTYGDAEETRFIMNSAKPLYTILGSYFGPNIKGIKWFLKNVVPYVDIRLRIVGKDMDKLKDEIDCTNVEIFSSVPDLKPYMVESDYMVYPIFDGSGMKVKTCEALMYAKNIVATPEAFSGYEIEDYSLVGACCSSAQEFINAISSLKLDRFNMYSRMLFKEKYSFECSVDRYRKALFGN